MYSSSTLPPIGRTVCTFSLPPPLRLNPPHELYSFLFLNKRLLLLLPLLRGSGVLPTIVCCLEALCFVYLDFLVGSGEPLTPVIVRSAYGLQTENMAPRRVSQKTVGRLTRAPPNNNLGKATRKNSDATQPFNIESVVCGDGSRKNGVALRNLVIYASERADGGYESYHEIDGDSLRLSMRGSRKGGNWNSRPVSDKSRNLKLNSVPKINIPAKKRHNHAWKQDKLRHLALRWLYQHRGVALSVGGPGARGDIDEVERYLVKDQGTVYVQEEDGNCLGAAIVNGLDIVRGRTVADSTRDYFEQEIPHFLRLRDTVRLLHDLGTGAEMRKLPKADRAIYNENPFRYLASRETGVYIVHLVQHRVVNHAVVIDAHRKLIIDSEEEYPLTLTEAVLRKCGGEEADNLQVEDLRLIVDQSKGNPSNH